MRPRMLPTFAGSLLLCSAVMVIGSAATTSDGTLHEIAPYREWRRVTEKPIPVVNLVAGGD